MRDTTLSLDVNGNASIDPSELIAYVSDNCGVVDTSYTGKTSFTCSDIGLNQVIVRVSDASGNSTVETAWVNVISQDTVRPEVVVVRDTTVYLDQNGQAGIEPYGLITSVSDNCGVVDTVVNGRTHYDCSDVGKTLQIVFDVRDKSGNLAEDTAFVMVKDTISPVLYCVVDTTIISKGPYNVQDSSLDARSTDNCSVASLINDLNSTGTLYGETLAQGENLIVWTATDQSGNLSQCTSRIIVQFSTVIMPVNDMKVLIYPNPTHGIVNIVNAQGLRLEIVDVNGHVIKLIKNVNTDRLELDMSHLPVGLYIMKFYDGRSVTIAKLIVE